MADSNAIGGHSTVFAQDLVLADTFVPIAEMRGAPTWGKRSRAKKDISPRGATIDSWLVGAIIHRGPFTATLNFIQSEATHGDGAGGLIGAYNAGTIFQVQIQGPEFSAGTIDDLIMTVFVEDYDITEGFDADERMGVFMFQPTGEETQNGVTIGDGGG